MDTHIKNAQTFLDAQYDAFEMHPCIPLDTHGKPVRHDDPSGMYYDRCDENDPNVAVWSVHGHLKQGGLEHMSDHLEKGEAENALQPLQIEQFGTKGE